MHPEPRHLDWPELDSESNGAQALAIVRRLQANGHVAFLAGGSVRNRLMGLAAKDFDVATSARPEAVERLFPQCEKVGAHFGVILALGEFGPTEIATFRCDGEYLDNRHPSSVHFTDAEQDASRRDFTINGLFYDPVSRRLIDYVGGLADLESRTLRAIGDPAARFREDALRLLRAVRFTARYGLQIEPATRSAIVQHAELLQNIGVERVREELCAIFTGANPGAGLRLLSELGLLDVVLPEMADMRGCPQPAEFHPEGDVFTHTALCMEGLGEQPSCVVAFGTLLHDVGKPATIEFADRIRFNRHAEVGAEMADRICRRLRFSNDDRKRIVELVDNHMRFKDIGNMRQSTLRRFVTAPYFSELIEVHRADCLGSLGNPRDCEFTRERYRELIAQEDFIPEPPLITGDDLKRMGHTPGPEFKRVLAAVYDSQLDGAIQTREAALAEAGRIFKS